MRVTLLSLMFDCLPPPPTPRSSVAVLRTEAQYTHSGGDFSCALSQCRVSGSITRLLFWGGGEGGTLDSDEQSWCRNPTIEGGREMKKLASAAAIGGGGGNED